LSVSGPDDFVARNLILKKVYNFLILHLFIFNSEITYPSDYVYAKDRLMAQYVSESFSKRLTIYIQLINVSSQGLQEIRGFCRTIGFQFHFAKPAVCQTYLSQTRPDWMPLGQLMLGKMGLLSTDLDPKDWAAVLSKISENPCIWMIAGQFEGHLLTPEAISNLSKQAATKRDIQADLISVLQLQGSSLLQTLQQPAQRLAFLVENSSSSPRLSS
jgi:ribosomal protein L10